VYKEALLRKMSCWQQTLVHQTRQSRNSKKADCVKEIHTKETPELMLCKSHL